MAVDYQAYMALEKKRAVNRPVKVEYKTVETSTAWANFEGWMDGQIKRHQERLDQAKTDAAHSGDYSHEGLCKHKVLIDIAQGELRILEAVYQKVKAYHEEP